jgi:peptidoglycan/xylan/chitin deacetylase (PgdA/CDA1 family)
MSIAFTCSIDDGHPSDLRTAELLSKHGLNGTFFVPIKNREGPAVMTGAQIREIGRRFEIGSHTYDHCFLRDIDITEAHYQINEGKKRLEDMLGRKVTGFCYPGGKYRQGDTDMVKAAGFRYARTTMNLCFDTGDNPFEMPTTVQFYPHHRNVYVRNFAKFGKWVERQNGLRLAVQHKNWIERLYAMFDHAARRGGLFHLWGHSKDIDQFNAWSELDRFLAYVASKVAPQNRLSNEQLAARYF